MIPPQILSCCQTVGAVDPAVAQRNLQTANTLVGLNNAVMQLLEMEITLLEAQPSDPRRSPRVGEALLWYGERLALTYLEPNIADYKRGAMEGCPVLLQAHALDPRQGGVVAGTEPVAQYCNMLLRAAVVYMTHWPGEKELVMRACKLLSVLVSPKPGLEKALGVAVQLDAFKQLIGMHGNFANREYAGNLQCIAVVATDPALCVP